MWHARRSEELCTGGADAVVGTVILGIVRLSCFIGRWPELMVGVDVHGAWEDSLGLWIRLIFVGVISCRRAGSSDSFLSRFLFPSAGSWSMSIVVQGRRCRAKGGGLKTSGVMYIMPRGWPRRCGRKEVNVRCRL